MIRHTVRNRVFAKIGIGITRQVAVNNNDTADFAAVALQDALIMQPAVVIGLIAQFTGYALQDDIAMAARRMQQLGNDTLNPQHKGGRHGSKTSAVPGKVRKIPKQFSWID